VRINFRKTVVVLLTGIIFSFPAYGEGLGSSDARVLAEAAAKGDWGALKEILTGKAHEYLEKLFKEILAKYGIKFPPDYAVGVPPVVVVGGREYETANEENQPFHTIDATGETVPNQKTILYCLKHKGSKECKKYGITRATDTAASVGATSGVYSTKTNEEIRKSVLANTETIAATSGVDITTSPKDEEELFKAFNQRGAYLIASTVSYSNVPLGKEYADNLPPEARKYYNFVALQQTAKEVFAKSHLRRMQLHYQKLLALKKLIAEVCDSPAETPAVECSSTSSTSLSSLPVRGGEMKSIETRGCCGCTTAAWKAAGHVISTISSRIAEAEKLLATTIDRDTRLMISTIQQEECQTRRRIQIEQTATRNLIKTVACLNFRLEFERLLLELDRYEAEIAQAVALQTKIQNENYELMDRAIKKAEETGYELVK